MKSRETNPAFPFLKTWPPKSLSSFWPEPLTKSKDFFNVCENRRECVQHLFVHKYDDIRQQALSNLIQLTCLKNPGKSSGFSTLRMPFPPPPSEALMTTG